MARVASVLEERLAAPAPSDSGFESKIRNALGHSSAQIGEMIFRVFGVEAAPFAELYGLSDEALAERNVVRYRVDEKPGFPDRIEMRDLDVGEVALLVNYVHQPADTPYRASHAIFVREGATHRYEAAAIPEVLRSRLLSVRAFDAEHMMTAADVVDGRELESLVESLLARDDVAYLHVHYAKRGCYAARIERARASATTPSPPEP